MPVITFANTKGGAGKTTAVLLLVSELLRRGYRITLIDADPQRWISRWCENASDRNNLNLVSYVTAQSIPQHIVEGKRRSDYVIVDLPGACTPMMAIAIGISDHVIIPIQGCTMDAQGGAQVLELLAYLERRARLRIAHSVLLSRVNSMVTTRALQTVKALLAERNVDVLDTPIIERSVYRDMFENRSPIHLMDPARVSNLDKAIRNAVLYADEILARVPCRLAEPAADQAA